MKDIDISSEYSRKLGRSVTYLHRQKVKYMNDNLKEYDLQGAMYMILHYVDHNPGTSQDAIVMNLYIDKCTVARRTKKLEELGYIYRETDAVDRRQNNLFVTEKGKKLVPLIHHHLKTWSHNICKDLTEDEKETIVRLLDKVVNSCEP